MLGAGRAAEALGARLGTRGACGRAWQAAGLAGVQAHGARALRHEAKWARDKGARQHAPQGARGSMRRRGRAAAGAEGAREACGLGAGRAAWARGLARAVHLVHSACFRPGLTQYCS